MVRALLTAPRTDPDFDFQFLASGDVSIRYVSLNKLVVSTNDPARLAESLRLLHMLGCEPARHAGPSEDAALQPGPSQA